MQQLKSLAIVVAALGGAVAAAPAAQACVTFQTATVTGNYDPFSGSVTISQPLHLTATRDAYADHQKTQEADFFFLLPPGSNPGYQIIWSASGASILEPYPGHAIVFSNDNPNQVYINYGGVGQPDQASFDVQFTIPINADLPAGVTTIPFDLKYDCKLTGGGNNPDVTGIVPGDLQIQVTVLSALKVGIVGATEFDFGEIGKLKTTDLSPTHDAINTRSSSFHVQSTGLYLVSVTSDNNYRMVAPGGSAANPNETITYQMDFLGETVPTGKPWDDVTCERATLQWKTIPISLTLLEGGWGKALSIGGHYSDTLNVTFTPLAVPPAQPTTVCGSAGGG